VYSPDKDCQLQLDDAEELRQHAFRLGAHGFIAKPKPPEALLAEVRQLLRYGG
jgi:DNA-binding NarL/FixJ family response regulator